MVFRSKEAGGLADGGLLKKRVLRVRHIFIVEMEL